MTDALAAPKTSFLLVAYSVPGRAAGTPVIIQRLLENLDPGEVVLIGRPVQAKSRTRTDKFKHKVIKILAPPINTRGERIWRVLSVLPGLVVGLYAIWRFRLQVIMAVYPDEGSLLTGYLLHRISGLPFTPYFCDLYLEQNRTNWQGSLAKWLQPHVLRAASKVLVVNDGMKTFYEQRYDLKPITIPTCLSRSSLEKTDGSHSKSGPFVIGFSGNVNDARIDAMRVLVEAIRGRKEFRLRYFTPQSQEELEREGLWLPNAERFFIERENDLILELSLCDALYLPLTFERNRRDKEAMATCFGIKSYEYLVSGVPVLVHCPKEYYTAKFFNDVECGLVVTEPNPKSLLDGLEKLRRNSPLANYLVKNAKQVSQQFKGRVVRNNLRHTLGEVIDA